MRFVVYAEATREFYDKTPGDNSHPKYKTLLGTTNITGVVLGDQYNPRVTVTLDNKFGQTKRLFLGPPLACRAELYDDDGLLFSGFIDDVQSGETYTIQAQAGESESFLNNVRLRTTAAWGSYKSVEVIPRRYGTTTGRCLQYDDTKRLYVWADHASSVITEVTVDGEISKGWEWRNGADSTGSPVTFIEFTQPVDGEVVATGRGKVSTQSGLPIENPADVLADVLGLDEDALSAFRAEAEGQIVSGELAEFQSAQTAANDICASFGAVFSPLMTGFARTYPGGTSGRAHLMPKEPEVECTASADEVANVIVMDFDYRNGEAKQSIEMEAPDSIVRFGRRERRIEAKWIADGRVAMSVATKALQKYARANWQISVRKVKGRVRPGDTITLDHAILPVTGSGFVETATYNPADRTTDITTSVPYGSVPRVSLVRQSQAVVDDQALNLSGQNAGTEYELMIDRPDGSVVANAKVILDGQYIRQSDSSGRVTFPVALMTPGVHKLEITPPTGSSFAMTVNV